MEVFITGFGINEPDNSSANLPSYPTRFYFRYAVTNITGLGLDSLVALSTDSHLPTLTVKSTRRPASQTQTDIIVVVARIVPVAVRRTAVPGIIVPRPTAQQSVVA
jgi:hypothetical protein